MKKVKSLKSWGIYELSAAEQEEYGFSFAVMTPETMECYGPCGLLAEDTDWNCGTLEEAVSWIENHKEA